MREQPTWWPTEPTDGVRRELAQLEARLGALSGAALPQNADAAAFEKDLGALSGVAVPQNADTAAFEKDGFIVLRNFCSEEECGGMMAAMAALIDAWDPAELSVFRTDGGQQAAQGSDDYFMTSADKVRFFLEAGALDEASGALRVPKERALNKVGHALHEEVRAFAAYAQSAKLQAAVRRLGWKSPDLVQSMYIFKQPRIGGEVTPHQDSAFLRTAPLSCLGCWLALQPATEANGCLWARPGSHREPLRRHFRREPLPGAPGRVRMGFESLLPEGAPPAAAAAWDGKPLDLAAGPASLGFVPLPVGAGDLVLLHGQLDHLSMPNTSEASRHSFQLHLVEGAAAGVAWHEGNWLQYPEGKPFPRFRP